MRCSSALADSTNLRYGRIDSACKGVELAKPELCPNPYRSLCGGWPQSQRLKKHTEGTPRSFALGDRGDSRPQLAGRNPRSSKIGNGKRRGHMSNLRHQPDSGAQHSDRHAGSWGPTRSSSVSLIRAFSIHMREPGRSLARIIPTRSPTPMFRHRPGDISVCSRPFSSSSAACTFTRRLPSWKSPTTRPR